MESENNLPSNVEYLDFELEIGNGSGRSYPIAVVRSAAGETRETMYFPFDELALENRLLILQNALLRSGGKRRRLPSPEELTVQEFGQALFEALFVGDVRSQYAVCQREASLQGKGLRLKLRIQSPDLAALPWEFLYDPREAEYICLSSHTPIVRYIELPRPPQPLTVIPPLRILAMIANPQDLDLLDIEREQQRVEKALKQLQTDGLVKLTWLQGQTWQDLQRAMRRGPWHSFHFIGHGGFDRYADEGLIALSTDEGSAHYLSATQVGRLLADHRSLRLVMLNSCEGARGSKRDIFSSTASILVQRGIPAVLAMQYEITDRAAVELSRAFYEAIADGMAVDAAVGEARKAISLEIVNTVEWGTPVLYMRAPSGVLFDLVANSAPKIEGQSIMPQPFISPSIPSISRDEPAVSSQQASSKDFFISYTAADRDWAEWVAWQLEEAGYSILIQVWDFRAGSNFVLNMQKALQETKRVVLVLSDHYLRAGFTQPEWAAAFRQDPQGEQGVVVPVRVQECQPEGLLGSVVYIDLVGLEESEARRRLLEDILSERGKPATPPNFPHDSHRTLKRQPLFPLTQAYQIQAEERFIADTSKEEASLRSTQEQVPSLVTTAADPDTAEKQLIENVKVASASEAVADAMEKRKSAPGSQQPLVQQLVPAQESSVAEQTVKSQSRGEINTPLPSTNDKKRAVSDNVHRTELDERLDKLYNNNGLDEISQGLQAPAAQNTSTTTSPFSPSKSSLTLNQKVENQKEGKLITILAVSFLLMFPIVLIALVLVFR